MTDVQETPDLPPIGAQDAGQQEQLFSEDFHADELNTQQEHPDGFQGADPEFEQFGDAGGDAYAALQQASREMNSGEDDYADYDQYLDQVAMESEAANAEEKAPELEGDEPAEDSSEVNDEQETSDTDKIDWANDSAERILAAMAPVLLEDAWRHEERQAIARQRLSEGGQPGDSGGEGPKGGVRAAIAASIFNRGIATADRMMVGGGRTAMPGGFAGDKQSSGAGRDHLAVHAHTAMASITDQVNSWKAASAAGDAEKKREAIEGIQKSFERLGELTAAKSSVDRNVGAGALAQVQSACAARDIIKRGCQRLMDDPALKGHADINGALEVGTANFLDKLKEVFKNIISSAAKMLGVRNGIAPPDLGGRVEPNVGQANASSSPKMG